ncbi:CBS domain-containing protein [Candidatus Micrarchaeota archaeon]|nr:CBS domain-containing protein [Candidatus Micrarchaeota archaeon]MBU1930882.1 CBS domain-containing protein [Candidatus Micrarchaeota archaeon]
MKVRDVYMDNSGFVDRVLESDSIEKVVAVMGAIKTTRTVFVVDKSENLLGVITIQEIFDRIFDEMKPRIIGWFRKKKEKDLKARDIMRPVTSVSLDDELGDALRVASAAKLQDLPVCEDGKVVGELDCFELLAGLVAENKNYFKE